MMRVITFKADEELLEMLDSIARIKGVSRSEVIREAIKKYIKEEEEKIFQSISPRRVTHCI